MRYHFSHPRTQEYESMSSISDYVVPPPLSYMTCLPTTASTVNDTERNPDYLEIPCQMIGRVSKPSELPN